MLNGVVLGDEVLVVGGVGDRGVADGALAEGDLDIALGSSIEHQIDVL